MPVDEFWFNGFASVTPTIGVGLIFWFVIRAIIHADRNGRKAYGKAVAVEEARHAKKRETINDG